MKSQRSKDEKRLNGLDRIMMSGLGLGLGLGLEYNESTYGYAQVINSTSGQQCVEAAFP